MYFLNSVKYHLSAASPAGANARTRIRSTVATKKRLHPFSRCKPEGAWSFHTDARLRLRSSSGCCDGHHIARGLRCRKRRRCLHSPSKRASNCFHPSSPNKASALTGKPRRFQVFSRRAQIESVSIPSRHSTCALPPRLRTAGIFRQRNLRR